MSAVFSEIKNKTQADQSNCSNNVMSKKNDKWRVPNTNFCVPILRFVSTNTVYSIYDRINLKTDNVVKKIFSGMVFAIKVRKIMENLQFPNTRIILVLNSECRVLDVHFFTPNNFKKNQVP